MTTTMMMKMMMRRRMMSECGVAHAMLTFSVKWHPEVQQLKRLLLFFVKLVHIL